MVFLPSGHARTAMKFKALKIDLQRLEISVTVNFSCMGVKLLVETENSVEMPLPNLQILSVNLE